MVQSINTNTGIALAVVVLLVGGVVGMTTGYFTFRSEDREYVTEALNRMKLDMQTGFSDMKILMLTAGNDASTDRAKLWAEVGQIKQRLSEMNSQEKIENMLERWAQQLQLQNEALKVPSIIDPNRLLRGGT